MGFSFRIKNSPGSTEKYRVYARYARHYLNYQAISVMPSGAIGDRDGARRISFKLFDRILDVSVETIPNQTLASISDQLFARNFVFW